MHNSLIESSIKELNALLNTLAKRFRTSADFMAFVRELGWDFPDSRIPDFSELVNEHIPILMVRLSSWIDQ